MSVVSADVYRPAAIAQLETLASDVGAGFIRSSAEENPLILSSVRCKKRIANWPTFLSSIPRGD